MGGSKDLSLDTVMTARRTAGDDVVTFIERNPSGDKPWRATHALMPITKAKELATAQSTTSKGKVAQPVPKRTEERPQALITVVINEGALGSIIEAKIGAALANGKFPAAEKDWMKAAELAELYGMPKTWFEEKGRAGEISRTKPGRYVLFYRPDVEAFLEKNKTNG